MTRAGVARTLAASERYVGRPCLPGLAARVWDPRRGALESEAGVLAYAGEEVCDDGDDRADVDGDD